MSKTAYIFDLDRTVICSDHRVNPCMLPNGDLDLQRYIDTACTPELVAQDSLLPLADYMRDLIAQKQLVFTCTARFMQNHDYIYLRRNNLRTAVPCSRVKLARVFGESDAKIYTALSDAEYKRVWLEHLMQTNPDVTEWIFFDDHQGVLTMTKEFSNVTAQDAILMNKLLSQTWADLYRQGQTDATESIRELMEECEILDCVLPSSLADDLLAE